MSKAAAVEPGKIRYNVVMSENRGGFATQALAYEVGTVVSTVNSYDGEHNLAIIDAPAGDVECLEWLLEDDDRVIGYRAMNGV